MDWQLLGCLHGGCSGRPVGTVGTPTPWLTSSMRIDPEPEPLDVPVSGGYPRLPMPDFTPVISKEAIDQQVTRMATTISADSRGRELVMIGVLKGAFVFLADLIRRMTLESFKIDFLQASSYGADTVSSETIVLKKDIDIDIREKDVLLVEDIVDTGLTLAYLIDHLKRFGPRSVKVCAMIDKMERRKAAVHVDYACTRVKEGFLVGYGLDYAEEYRNLPAIYHMQL